MLSSRKVYAILARDSNNGIGYNNDLLFRNDIDLKWFKSITESINTCVVGSTTYNTLPKVISKTRDLYVLTSKKNFKFSENVNTINTMNDLDLIYPQDKSFIVIGGAKVYEYFAPFIDVWLVTTFKENAELVDTYLSNIVIKAINDKKDSIVLHSDECINIVMHM